MRPEWKVAEGALLASIKGPGLHVGGGVVSSLQTGGTPFRRYIQFGRLIGQTRGDREAPRTTGETTRLSSQQHTETGRVYMYTRPFSQFESEVGEGRWKAHRKARRTLYVFTLHIPKCAHTGTATSRVRDPKITSFVRIINITNKF